METREKLTLINKFLAWLEWQNVDLCQDGKKIDTSGSAESFLCAEGHSKEVGEIQIGEAMRKLHDPYYSLYENPE